MKSKIFVLSLKESTDRRKKIINNFNNYGLKFDFFDAYKGYDVPKRIINNNLSIKVLGKKLSSGEIGCAYSHYLLLKKLVADKNHDFYLIFEDDVSLVKNFKKIYKIIINLDLSINNLIIFTSGYDFFPRFKTKIFINEDYNLFRNAGSNWGTYGMVVSKNIAQKILKNYEKGIFLPADFYGRKHYEVKIPIYGLYPPVLYHPHLEENPNNSIIGASRRSLYEKVKIFFMKNLSNLKSRILQWF